MAERIPQFREIVAFRNILVHGYTVLDHDVVWRVVRDDLPKLLATLTDLLGED